MHKLVTHAIYEIEKLIKIIYNMSQMIDKETNTINSQVRFKSPGSGADANCRSCVVIKKRKQIAVAYSPFRYNPMKLDTNAVLCSSLLPTLSNDHQPPINRNHQSKNCCNCNLLRTLFGNLQLVSQTTSDEAIQTDELIKLITFAHKGTMTKTYLNNDQLKRSTR